MKRGPGTLAHKGGAIGEDQAASYLQGLGYRIVERNFRTRMGEVDIIARDGDFTVFVEVKRRLRADHGTAADFISPAKIRRVVMAARLYAARQGLSESPIRFDVVSIDEDAPNSSLRHHKGAFDAR